MSHLHPLYMYLREVPCAPEIMRARKAVLDLIRLPLLGPGKSLLEMSARVPAWEVFTSPADIPDDIQEAMDALCLEVGEEPPSTYALEGTCTLPSFSTGGCRPTWWVTLTRTPSGSIGHCCWGFESTVGLSGPSQ